MACDRYINKQHMGMQLDPLLKSNRAKDGTAPQSGIFVIVKELSDEGQVTPLLTTNAHLAVAPPAFG